MNLNIGLWIIQGSLLAIYGSYGIYKTFFTSRARNRMAWAENRSENFVRFVGLAEIFGALGVVLPMLLDVFVWITPLAAIGLSLLQVFAISTEHIPKKEYKILPLNIYFMALSIAVVVGRWSLFGLST